MEKRMKNFLKGFTLAVALAFATGAAVVPAEAHAAQGPAAPGPRHIYSETANPRADIAAALKQARREHKRVILDFGGDWCPDCQMLDIYFHDPQNEPILEKNFILVHVWIGHIDRNLDVAAEHGAPLKHGVPALAVLDAHGKTVYAQTTGQFSNMRAMDKSSVTEFLNKWKG
jgi:thiol:disulfide interchange protein